MRKTYSIDSPIPNWPYTLSKKGFSFYCTPVLHAINEWFDKILNNSFPRKTEAEKVKINEVRQKYLSQERDQLTYEEMEIIQKWYKMYIDELLLKSSY